MTSEPEAPGLTWGLTIATKDRIDELCVCVELAMAQTRPPSEIVIVDASAEWERNAQRIREIVAGRTRLAVAEARLPSSSEQRNQALDMAEADIVFMIDDDSFMYPDCAERIMSVYDADVERGLVGVQATLSRTMPGQAELDVKRGEGTSAAKVNLWKYDAIWRSVLLMGSEQIFLPYGDSYPDRPVPATLDRYPVRRERLFHGARMTFRRAEIASVRFDSLLRYYAPFEDLDASHRMSRQGALVTVENAYLYHHMTETNRLQRFRVTWLSMLNQAVLLKRHADDPAVAKRRYYTLMARRILAEFLKDTMTRRFGFPQCRGALHALRDARKVFSISMSDLEAWYPDHQAKILKS